jgi:hypothetical protein
MYTTYGYGWAMSELTHPYKSLPLASKCRVPVSSQPHMQ